MAKARFDIPTQIPTAVTRPLYAGVGVTDRVVEAVRETVADVQKRAVAVQQDVTKTVAGLDYQPQALRRQATQVAGDTLQQLVERGESLVGRIRRQSATTATVESAKTTTAKAKTTRTQATKTATAAKKSARTTASRTTKKAAKSPARSSAKATATSAKKTASSAARATKDAGAKVGRS
jgi:heparin binding hemagglutinin HbhA